MAHPRPRNPTPADALSPAGLERLGSALAAALARALERACGPDARLRTLERMLGLDKSLASNLLRAAAAPSGLGSLAVCPAPQGLTIFAEALRNHGAADVAAGMSQLSDELAALIDALPGGRAELDAVLGGLLPEHRAARDRHARQAGFRVMSALHGLALDQLYYLQLIAPDLSDPEVIPPAGPAGRTQPLDFAQIAFLARIRRARPGARMPVAGFLTNRGNASAGQQQALTGEPITADAANALVRPLCRPRKLSGLSVRPAQLGNSNGCLLELAAEFPPLGKSVDLATAFRLSRGFPAVATESIRHYNGLFIIRRPVRRFAVDLLIHKSVLPGAFPLATVSMPTPRGLPDPSRPDDESMDRLDQPVEHEILDSAELAPSTDPSARPLRPALAQLFGSPAAVRRALASFRLHRFSMEYPVCASHITIWLPLPDAPAPHRG